MKMHMLTLNLYTCLFSKDGGKNMNYFIVKKTNIMGEKMKRILQEPISLPKSTPLGNNPWMAFQYSPINWAHMGKLKAHEVLIGSNYLMV
jgi:hypothetical protein